MTSCSSGEGGFKNRPILRTNSTDRLRECVTKGGEGVQNPENFADVIKVSPLSPKLQESTKRQRDVVIYHLGKRRGRIMIYLGKLDKYFLQSC